MFAVHRPQDLGGKARVSLYLCFIDLQKAHDSVDRTLLWQVLARFGVPLHTIAVIRQFQDGTRSCAWNDEGVCSEWFDLSASSLTISESKTEIICMPISRAPAAEVVFNATGKQYRHNLLHLYLGGTVTETPNLSAKIDRRIRAGWGSFRSYTRELYDCPKALHKSAAPEGLYGEIQGSG